MFLLVLAVTVASVSSSGDPFHDVQPALPIYFSPINRVVFVDGVNPKENSPQYWRNVSLDAIRQRLAITPNTGEAKNVILFLGDGMSIATLTAARIYLGQLNKEAGENSQLSFEKFPYTGLSKTYCVDSQVADSACSGTAYLTGVKGNIYTVGVTSDVKRKDWKAMQNESFHTSSILQWAQDKGKGTGIVTTCRITDASPAASYAHSAYRMWQSDKNIKDDEDVKNVTGIRDIAAQLIENSPGKNLKVILGGGRESFLPNRTQEDPISEGVREDGKDLIQEWKSSKKAANKSASYITNRDQLLGLDVNNTEYVLGLFQPSHMAYHKLADEKEQPTLSEMTTLAIKMMQKEAKGFVLFIEGGKIDIGHHENKAHLALDETVELHKAVEVAVNMTSQNDTLIVVTADHAHTMNINGYPSRGGDILTYMQGTQDKLAYSTLSYANGPNAQRFTEVKVDETLNCTQQHNIFFDTLTNPNYTYQTINLLPAETHDGQDVAVFARGPWAHLLVGNYEQTVIPHVMGYAARIGPAAEAISFGAE